MTQIKLNVRRGDKVVVITGKDAGKQGTVLACSPKNNKVIVEGVNIVNRHTKPRSAQESGGIIKKEGTIDISNVMIVCPSCGKPTRIGHKIVDGKSVRVCKCGEVIERKNKFVANKKDKKEKATKTSAEENKVTAPAKGVEKNLKAKLPKATINKAATTQIKRKQEM